MIYSIIPIHGIVVEKNFIFKKGDNILWGITNPNDNSFYKRFTPNNESLIGNLEMITERLNPHSFLFTLNPRIKDNVWDDAKCELILSCLSLLINYKRIFDESESPVPIFRKRLKELADFPISFKETGIHSVGHTSRIGLYSWAPLSLSIEHLEDLINSSTGSFNQILNCKGKNKKTINDLLTFIRVFDNINIGGLIASELTVIEQLISDNDSWKDLRSKLKFIFTKLSDDIDQLFEERNIYIHQGLLPKNDAMTIIGFRILIYLIFKKEKFEESNGNISFKKYLDLKHYIGTEKELLNIKFQLEL